MHPDGSKRDEKKGSASPAHQSDAILATLEAKDDDDAHFAENPPDSNLSCLTFEDLEMTLKESKRRISAS